MNSLTIFVPTWTMNKLVGGWGLQLQWNVSTKLHLLHHSKTHA